jgi:hypothetical protein
MELAQDRELDDREERWAVDSRLVAEGEEAVRKKATSWMSASCTSPERPR